MNSEKYVVRKSEIWTYILVDDYLVNMVRYAEPREGLFHDIDVHVNFEDGRHYVATFWELSTIIDEMKRAKETGELAHGKYFWASDMIIIEELTYDNICDSIRDMMAIDDFETAFYFCEKDDDDDYDMSEVVFREFRALE